MAEEKLTVWEKRLKSIENENEMQKQKHQEEITEYKEQIKQHSKTIVDLENKFVEAVQKLKAAKEENAKLQKQIEGQQRKQRMLLSGALGISCHTWGQFMPTNCAEVF